jgi:sporulation protein YlmC with PRC-barrel domain
MGAHERTIMNTQPNILSAGTLTGDTVRNSDGETLGSVEEIMLDLNHGSVAYVVLASGGFLGVGQKYFAVPWELMRLDADAHEFILDVPKERLADAPGFDHDNWPDMSDVGWGDSIHDYYGVSPYWTAIK